MPLNLRQKYADPVIVLQIVIKDKKQGFYC